MFSQPLSESTIVELIREVESEDGSTVKLELRVLNKKRWGKLMVELLVSNIDEEDYGISVSKSYWANEETEKINFCWVVLIWGDLNQAIVGLSPVLSRKAKPPKPTVLASSVPLKAGGPQLGTILDRRPLQGSHGVRGMATIIRLPHRSPRTGHQGRTKKPGDIGKRGKWGFADGFAEDTGGDPWY